MVLFRGSFPSSERVFGDDVITLAQWFSQWGAPSRGGAEPLQDGGAQMAELNE